MAEDELFGAAFDDDIFEAEKVRNPIAPLQVQKASYTAKHEDHGVSLSRLILAIPLSFT